MKFKGKHIENEMKTGRKMHEQKTSFNIETEIIKTEPNKTPGAEE